MTRAETYGHRFTLAVAEYLKANSLLSLGKINARILADIAQQFHDNEKKVVKRKVQLASEEEWLKEIEADPAMAALDVRKELGMAQFWCKPRNRQCTRKFFLETWLMRALKDSKTVGRSYDGATSKPAKPQPPKPRYTLDTPVPSWPMLLRNYITLSPEETDRLCLLDWDQLPVDVRTKIIQVA